MTRFLGMAWLRWMLLLSSLIPMCGSLWGTVLRWIQEGGPSRAMPRLDLFLSAGCVLLYLGLWTAGYLFLGAKGIAIRLIAGISVFYAAYWGVGVARALISMRATMAGPLSFWVALISTVLGVTSTLVLPALMSCTIYRQMRSPAVTRGRSTHAAHARERDRIVGFTARVFVLAGMAFAIGHHSELTFPLPEPTALFRLRGAITFGWCLSLVGWGGLIRIRPGLVASGARVAALSGAVVALIYVGVGGWGYSHWVGISVSPRAWVVRDALEAVAFTAVPFVMWLFWRQFDAPEGVLNRTDCMCWACGYDLRGSKDGRCPECGVLARVA